MGRSGASCCGVLHATHIVVDDALGCSSCCRCSPLTPLGLAVKAATCLCVGCEASHSLTRADFVQVQAYICCVCVHLHLASV